MRCCAMKRRWVAQSTMSAGLAAKRRESPALLAQLLRVANDTGIAHNVFTMPATDIVHIGRRLIEALLCGWCSSGFEAS